MVISLKRQPESISRKKNTHDHRNPDQNFLHRALKINPSNTWTIITEYEYVFIY